MTTYTDRQKACIRDVLTSMECTAQWLENGCDPKEAAAEIRLAMSRLTVESTSPITGFSEPDGGAGDVQAVIAEMIAVATGEDDDGDWPIELRAEVDKWQSRLQIALAAPSQSAAPAVDVAVAQGERLSHEQYKAVREAMRDYGFAASDVDAIMGDIYVRLKRASDAQAPAAHAGATLTDVKRDELISGLLVNLEKSDQRETDFYLVRSFIGDLGLAGACRFCGTTTNREDCKGLNCCKDRQYAPSTTQQRTTLTDEAAFELIQRFTRFPEKHKGEAWCIGFMSVADVGCFARALLAPTPVADSGAMPVTYDQWSAIWDASLSITKGEWIDRVMKMLAAAKPVSVDAPTAAVDDGQGVPEEFKEWFRLEWSKYQDKAISDGMVTSMTWALKGYRAARTSMPERKALVDPEIHLAMIEATKRSISPGPSWHWARAFAKDIERRIATPAGDSATPNETGEAE